ncbi:hypothetical protein [Halalkalibacter urbisdiaboli]|uniref:hypothetical protein n=1 Tax=Halalkalibacter urbisdiaboli TaxID=1960589 RepID=UPI0013FDA6A2|nr:hypothetical protein [Halalkalibacter urbisdiaboli]
MSFQPEKVKKLVKQDRFLSMTYEEIIQDIQNEHEALYYIYTVYIQKEPILLNAYDLV